MSEEKVRTIIIYKKKKGEHGHHGGAWKVAFADFMTAMFALFLVLWILTQSQDVKSAIASYFRHPTDYEGKPDANFHGNDGLMENKQGRLDLTPNMLEINAQPKNGEDQGGSKGQEPESISGGSAKSSAEPGLRPELVDRVEDQEKDEVRSFLKIADDLWVKMGMNSGFKKFKDNLLIEAIEDGLVIQLVEQPGAPLFEDGRPDFKPSIRECFAVLARELSHYTNKLEVDGHGNAVPWIIPAEQKWVASAYMADRARAELERQGLKPAQITKVAGCGDTRPLNPRDPKDPLNQRISILVRPRQWRPERF